ncbi:glycosyl transferase group 1 [Pseudopedobacter saltans DSM 12145]|uniref:Glycosyl transferase group 1 n=1 Tax=Pseudopedobacter saltans (strain ATCC 51119 / DSM 12145 / JCM 21818 / CCUG 39354 / LMG 10337 / NBRC 100064 / NCIMB 13643) TaxID=762903 RepID=F0SD70_PSESL|nr:glycosyltransferase family 4 protein [Pseudopedobacter saltans]ADY52856.1 glycosyl transferase group 1 [Pseudopedobacter saltans DSM 12145]
MTKKVLFLTLKTFSFTGGIEKACRTLISALKSIPEVQLQVWSMYDDTAQVDPKYITSPQFKGFNNKKLHFAKKIFTQSSYFDTVVLSHINLLLFGLIIKWLAPKTKIILWAHGIEVWRAIPKWKKNFIQRSCGIWAVSTFTKNELIRLHQLNESQIQVVNNSLDPFFTVDKPLQKPDYLLERYGIGKEQKVFFTLTRLSHTEHQKNYDTIISCIEKLKTIYPDIIYLIGGKADTVEQERLSQLIASKDLTAQVKLIGFVPNSELEDHYLLADYFVLPSQKEGFGIVFIEATANGCNVLAGNQDGSVDALRNGELGILVNPNDPKEIYTGLERMMLHPIDKDKQRELTLKHFSFESYEKRIEELLLGEEILYDTSY